MAVSEITPPRAAETAPNSDLDRDVLSHILSFCPISTLSNTARASQLLHELSIPLLYRHLSVDLALPNPFFAVHPDLSGLDGRAHLRPTSNPYLHHTRSLHILPHFHLRCCAISQFAIRARPIAIPNVRSILFLINDFTGHWPRDCRLLRSFHPTPEELVLSAEPGTDVLWWAFSARYCADLPEGLKRLVFIVKYDPESVLGPDAAGRQPELVSRIARELRGGMPILRYPSKEIVLVYDDSWDTGGSDKEAVGKVETGNVAVLALVVAGQVTIHGWEKLVDGDSSKAEVWRLIEETVKELVELRGNPEGEIKEAMARIRLSDVAWTDA